MLTVTAPTVDLEALKALYTVTDDAVNWHGDPWEAVTYMPALVAEVEQLRCDLDVTNHFDHRGSGATSRALVALSRWIDEAPSNANRDREAATWGRLAKLSEEVGEVIAAYIGATGQNPRKGVTDDIDSVAKELLDVAVTALCAYEHITDQRGDALPALFEHVARVTERARGAAVA